MIEILGYTFISVVALGVLFIFFKMLAIAIHALANHDD